MFGKIGDFFSTTIDSCSETLSRWSEAIGFDSSSYVDSSSCSTGQDPSSAMTAESDHFFGVGNAWGTACDNQVFAEANYEFAASDFSSSFGAGSAWDSGSSFDSNSSSSSSLWD
jgi:hypothetical protein